MVLILVADALNIKTGFQQTVIFPWGPFVPLRLTALASGCYLSVRRFENDSEEANHPYSVTKQKP